MTSNAVQPGSNQFDRFGAGASGRIVQQQVMAASGLDHKLALLLKWLSQFDFGADHDFLLLLLSTKHTNKCTRLDFVTGKFAGEWKRTSEGYVCGRKVATTRA